MHWCSPLAHNVAAQVAGELKMIANQVHLPKNRFTTSIKRVYFVHKRRNNTHKRHFFLFVLCPPTLNIHFFSVASFISYFSVSFSGSHTTSRFLCHFQYLILHPGCSVIFSISFYIEVSPSSSVSHSISRFRYLVLHPGFSVIFSILFYIQVSLSFSVSHFLSIFSVIFSGWTCAWTWCRWWGRHGLVRHIVQLITSPCLQTANCDAYSPWSHSPQTPPMTMVSLQF